MEQSQWSSGQAGRGCSSLAAGSARGCLVVLSRSLGRAAAFPCTAGQSGVTAEPGTCDDGPVTLGLAPVAPVLFVLALRQQLLQGQLCRL